MTPRFTCARRALELGEPAYGTASQVRRWLLVEQAGPWGRDAVAESRIPPDVARALKARARRLGARLLLIRRHHQRMHQPRRVYAAVTSQRGGFVECFEVPGSAAVLDLDLSPLAESRPSGGRPVEHPLFLVCTNGRHDVCCAEFGRPLARALEAAQPEATWECSHIGGDRFAANLVCLPEGVYYGRLGPLEAPAVAAAHLRGSIDLEHYRGRSCLPFVVQAAEHFLRLEHGLDRIDDLVAERRERLGNRAHRATFAVRDGRRFVVELAAAPDPQARRLTCGAEHELRPTRFTLLRIAAA